jgi:hypothetical protein
LHGTHFAAQHSATAVNQIVPRVQDTGFASVLLRTFERHIRQVRLAQDATLKHESGVSAKHQTVNLVTVSCGNVLRFELCQIVHHLVCGERATERLFVLGDLELFIHLWCERDWFNTRRSKQ